MLLYNQWITEEIKEKIEKRETNQNKSRMIQNLWDAAKAVLRGKLIAITVRTRKTLNKQPNFTPKTTGKGAKTTQN